MSQGSVQARAQPPPSLPAAPCPTSAAAAAARCCLQGAQYQKPRKIPLRIEPKTFFANERTFLAWLGMATTLGTISTAIAGFSGRV